MKFVDEGLDEVIRKIEEGTISEHALFKAIIAKKHDGLSQQQLNELIAVGFKKYSSLQVRLKYSREIDSAVRIAMLEHNVDYIERIPKELVTREMWMTVLDKEEFYIYKIPSEFIDKYNPNNEYFIQILERRRNTAIKEKALSLMPESERDRELCLKVLAEKWQELDNVPKNLLNDAGFMENEIVSNAVDSYRKSIKEDWYKIFTAPAAVIDRATAIAAAKQNWRALKYINKNDIEYDSVLETASNTVGGNETKEFLSCIEPNKVTYPISFNLVSKDPLSLVTDLSTPFLPNHAALA